MNSRLDTIIDWEKQAALAGYNLTLLAAATHTSRRHLGRFIKNRFQNAPKNWIVQLRMGLAVGLLKGGHQVQEVASQMSYARPSEFCRAFQHHFGVSPRCFLHSATVPLPANVP